MQTPPEASFTRTLDAVKRVEDYLRKRDGVDTVTFLTGFSFLGQGQNTAQAFITLKDWSEARPGRIRPKRSSPTSTAPSRRCATAKISALQPPPIDNLGNSSGFSFRLQDRGAAGYAALMRAKDQLLAAAAQSPVLQDVYVEGLSPAPQVELIVDREKAAALGVTFEDDQQHHLDQSRLDLHQRLSQPRPHAARHRAGRPSGRMQADDILTYNVRNSSGQLVPLSSFATVRWSVGPTQIVGFNYYPSVRICGSAKPGYTSGDAIAEMERLAARCRAASATNGPGSRCRRSSSGSQAPFLLGLSVLVVFLRARRALRELDDSARRCC